MTAAQAAHLRLLSTLPVRTHEQSSRPPAERGGHQPRALVIERTHYESVAEAARLRHCARDTIRRMIDRGEARYA